MTPHRVRIAVVGPDVPFVAPERPASWAGSKGASLAVVPVRHSQACTPEEALPSSNESADVIVATIR